MNEPYEQLKDGKLHYSVPYPRPGLPTFFHNLAIGFLMRYPLWYTLRRAWRCRDCALISIEPLSEADMTHITELVSKFGNEPTSE